MTEFDDGLYLIPGHMHDAIRAYVDTGRMPGHFLSAVLEGKLFEAYRRADDSNAKAMHGWVRFLYNHVPCGCYGSSEHVKDWVEQGGMKGVEA